MTGRPEDDGSMGEASVVVTYGRELEDRELLGLGENPTTGSNSMLGGL